MILINQTNIELVEEIEIDFLIVASGYEARAIFQPERLSKKAIHKFALGFDELIKDETRIFNDNILEKLEFKSIIINAEDQANIQLEDIINTIDIYSASKEGTVVYIDYSSMTRNWYSYLLFRLNNIINNKNIRLFFGYSHAEYTDSPKKQTLNRIVSPLFGYCDLCIPSKPTALIIGLGNEPNRIYGLKEYFDAVPYLFYSDTSYNEKYSIEVENLNRDIINEIKNDNVFKYPIHDLLYTHHILENLCLALSKKFRIVIASCGPKPFSLVAMINSLNHSNFIEVWRISPGSNIQKVDRKPTGIISLIEIKFI